MKNGNQSASPAQVLLDANFKGAQVGNQPRLVVGVSPKTDAFIICGECSDEGGGSSGQCACDK